MSDSPEKWKESRQLVVGQEDWQARRSDLLLQIASDGIHVLNEQGYLVDMSDSFHEALGYTREEMIGMHVSQWDVRWSAEALKERVRLLAGMEGERIFETLHRRKNGPIFDVEVRAKGFRVGTERMVICSSRDISARKQSESMIALQAGALNNSVNGIIISDASLPDQPVIYVNPAFERITGYTSIDIIGKNCRFLQGNDHDQPDLERLREVLTTGGSAKATLRNYRKDGVMFWNRLQMAPVMDQSGKVTHFVAIMSDITERKHSEDYLRLISRVFIHADESIFITDHQGLIVEANPAFIRTTGYERNEALGKKPNLLKSGWHDQEFYADLWQSLLTEGHWTGEIWNRRKNGDIYPSKTTISSVRDDDGRTLSYVCLSSDISVLKAQQRELEMLALHDPLTGLPNRALLHDRLAMALAEARRSGTKMAVCFMDLDGFKPVNDQFGHETGDLLLVEVARRMTIVLRSTDTVARLGGDEFVLILSEIQNEREFMSMLTRLTETVARPYELGGGVVTVSASIGVTLYPDDDVDAETLLRHADQAMYLAKEKGRNRVHFFDVVDERKSHERKEGRERVELALKASEFQMYYQPKVNLVTGRVTGMEALIRWTHPESGLLLPGAFLPLIENSDFETQLSEWVMTEVLAQMTVWQEQGLDLVVSVNLPACHLHSDQFVPFVQKVLAENPGVPRNRLELEVLETVALWDIPRVTLTMEACRELGAIFSIDDFGTGYASLAYLRRLPVDTIKIDQSFIRDMLNDPDDLSIVEGVIGLGDAFQKRAIAEGVETMEHALLLRYLGCYHAQGYGFARPMPAAQVPEWIASFRLDPLLLRAPNTRLGRKDMGLAFAEVWHRRWVQDLLCSVENKSVSIPPLDPRQCVFGKWLYSEGMLAYGRRPEFAVLERKHNAVHQMAQSLCRCHEKRSHQKTRQSVDQILVLRDELITSLHRLIETL